MWWPLRAPAHSSVVQGSLQCASHHGSEFFRGNFQSTTRCYTPPPAAPPPRPQILSNNPGPGKVKCQNGVLSPAAPSTCASKAVTLQPSDGKLSFQQWRMTPVPGRNRTYTIAAASRGGSCPRFLAVLGGCSNAPQTLGLMDKESAAAWWVAEAAAHAQGGSFVVRGAKGQPVIGML